MSSCISSPSILRTIACHRVRCRTSTSCPMLMIRLLTQVVISISPSMASRSRSPPSQYSAASFDNKSRMLVPRKSHVSGHNFRNPSENPMTWILLPLTIDFICCCGCRHASSIAILPSWIPLITSFKRRAIVLDGSQTLLSHFDIVACDTPTISAKALCFNLCAARQRIISDPSI